MNLALEYFIRSKTVRHCLFTPASLYLSNPNYQKDRIIITIDWHSFSNAYKVSQWSFKGFNPEHIFPAFKEYSVPKDDIFESDAVILKDYQIITFQESPYKSGVKQHNDQRGDVQDYKYKKTLDNFFNPERHQLYKKQWLWRLFIDSNCYSRHEAFFELDFDYQIEIVKTAFPLLYQKWCHWEKRFYFNYPVATELAFCQQYRAIARDLTKPKYISFYQKLGI